MSPRTRRSVTQSSQSRRLWRVLLGDGPAKESQLIALMAAILANRPIAELTRDWDPSRDDAWLCERHAPPG